MSSFLSSTDAWLAAQKKKLDEMKAQQEVSQAELKTGRPVTHLDEMDAFVAGHKEKPGRRFKVENVIDGDTLDLAGFGRVRLAGIDTPETVHPIKGVQPGGPEASAFTKKMAAGKYVTVKLQRGDTEDKYGRALTVIEDEEGNIFNTEIVKAGHSQQLSTVPTGAPITTPETGRLSREAVEAAKSGIKRGLLYPVSSFFAEDYRRLQREGDIHRRNLLQEMDSRGTVDGSVRDTVAMAPEVVGEMIGGLPANVATYSLASGLTGTAKALSLTGKVVRSMGAAGASAASLSALAQIDNGESRFAHMAKDFAVGAMFEVVGLPLMRKAWTAEIGEKVAKDATERIARDLGTSPDIIATHIDAIRAGGVGSDIRVLERLDAELKKNPTAAKSPLGAIVDRGKADWHHSVLPTDVVVNPNLREENKNFGIRGMLEKKDPTSGKIERIPFWHQSDPASRPQQAESKTVSRFEADVLAMRGQVDQLKREGFEVRMAYAEVQHSQAWSRFANIWYGSQGNPLPVFTQVEKGTYAAKSLRPKYGEQVKDKVTGKIVTAVDEVAAEDVLQGLETRTALRNAPHADLVEALDEARAAKDLPLMQLLGREIAEREKAGVIKAASQAQPVPADVPWPKGVQAPLRKFDEGEEALSRGKARTNEMGVAGYQRRTGENQLIRFLQSAKTENVRREVERKAARGELSPEAMRVLERRQSKAARSQALREEADAYREKSLTLSDEEAGRIPRSLEEVEAERAAIKERYTEALHRTPQGWTPFKIQVRNESGKIEHRTLAQIEPLTHVLQPAGAKGTLGLRPHSSGQVRHGVVDLSGKTVNLEDFDNPSLQWQGNAMRAIVDDDTMVGHTPRLFMHEEGLTFSIANTQQYDPLRGEWSMSTKTPVLGHEAKVTDVGPIDTLEAYQHPQRVYTSGAKEWTPVDVGSGMRSRIEMKRLTSGRDIPGRLLSRRSTTDTKFPSGGGFRSKDSYLSEQYETFASKADEVEPARRFDAGFTSKKAAEVGEPGTYHEVTAPRSLDRVPNELEPGMVSERPPSFAVSKADAEKHLELASAKQMAKVLIKEGADPSTSVRITVSGGQWDDIEAPFEWTLEELASQQFRPVAWQSMTAVAQSRGYQAIPDGFGVILKSKFGSTTFPSGEEALSYLTRIPRQKKFSPVIEKKLLEDWAMGGAERATDHPVDTARFRSVEIQESSIKDVIEGKSAATMISARDQDSLKAAVQGLAHAQQKGGVFEVVNITPLQATEKAGEMATKEPSLFFIYEESAFKTKVLQNQAALKKIGIDLSLHPAGIVRQLARYGDGSGLNFLYGQRDAGDQLLYAQLRQWRKASLFRQGGLQSDAHGAFRTYGPELRKQIGAALQANPPATSYDPALKARLPNAGTGGPEAITLPGGKKVFTKISEAPDSGGSGGGLGANMSDEEAFAALEDTGKLMAPIGGGSGDERIPLVELTNDAHDAVSEYLQQPLRQFQFTDYFRVPMQLFKEYQAATGIPFYRWWEQIDHGRTQVTRYTNPVFNAIHAMSRNVKAAERQQVGQLFEMRWSDPEKYARLKGTFPEIVQKGEALLDSTMRKFLEDLDLDAEKELSELPFFRKRNVDVKELRPYESGRPPSPITRKSNAFMDELPLDEREYDFSITMKRYARAIAHEKFLAPAWEEINKTMQQLQGTVAHPGVEQMLQIFNKHRAEAVHAQDRLGYGMAMGIVNIGKRLKMNFSMEEAQDIISTFTGANYFANLAFNLGVTGRNYLQVLQTVYPVMGAKATQYGVKKAIEWKRDPSLRKAMEELDIVNTDTMLEGLSNMQQALLESDTLHRIAKPMGKVVDLMNKGVAMYQSADDFNKVASYYAQYYHAEKAANRYLAGKTKWDGFLKESKLEFRDIRVKDPVTGQVVDGPLMTKVKQALAGGAPKSAAHFMALDFAKESQFMYSRGNAPLVLQSTLGRLLGQYGTWPSHYVEWVGNNMMFRRGSRSENVKNIARWGAVNATMFYGMSEVFGVDFARWSFFAPLSYQGGPLAQVGQQAAATWAATTSGEDDPVARIQAERLKGAWKQLVPFPTVAARSTFGAGKDIMEGEYAEGVKKFLGLPTTKGKD